GRHRPVGRPERRPRLPRVHRRGAEQPGQRQRHRRGLARLGAGDLLRRPGRDLAGRGDAALHRRPGHRRPLPPVARRGRQRPRSHVDEVYIYCYSQWLDEDAHGVVHIGFYVTRYSTKRTGVDFYYGYSADGGASWTDETRVTQFVSQNINNGQEWGDYNGLSV